MSPSKRPIILMAILLALLLAYLFQHGLVASIAGTAGISMRASAPPLPGKSSVSNLALKQKAGSWTAEFDYFYSGAPRLAALYLELLPHSAGLNAQPGKFQSWGTFVVLAQRGQHHQSTPIAYPGFEQTTRQIKVTLRDQMNSNTLLVDQQIDAVIDWPNWQTWIENQRFAQRTPEQNLKRAVELVDSGSDTTLKQAQPILERLINQDARFDPAYVELARVAMKSNWGPEGLHQAEGLLSSALQIRPDSANTKILLGYVYAHQNRFAKAQQLFTDAARSNPANLWLWSNWGELLAMQRNYAGAIEKYREAITRPVTHDSYDRARKDAYKHLLALLEQRKDMDGMEALYKQRVAEYGPGSCYSSGYARFMLQVRADTQGAIDLARRALNQDCEDSEARQVLGLAEYVKWAATTGTERTESLNQARIYLPAGPMPLYLLATHERTAPTIKQLMASGEQLEQKDNENQTALGYALQNRDLGAARRLLSLHARPDTPVGYGNMPVALIPVMEGNIEAIRLFREFGVDYSKLRYRGMTAIEFARQSGNHALLEALGRNAATTL